MQTPDSPAKTELDVIEAEIIDLVSTLEADPRPGPGRPRIVSATLLWTCFVLGVLRGDLSQLAVWRRVGRLGLTWRMERSVSDQAIYNRLAKAGPNALAPLFTAITNRLVERVDPFRDDRLAPWATDVVALDETVLDKLPKATEEQQALSECDAGRLAGRLACVFDIRRQLFRTVQFIPDARQNEKVAAREVLATLRPGSLILADLGYFSFAWFDTLTDQGFTWVSKLRARTSYEVVHVNYRDATLFDAMVWLGKHRANRAKHLVRYIEYQSGATTYRYLTNVGPEVATPAELLRLYRRRWNIERAFLLVKADLKLNVFWAAKPVTVQHQIWGVFIIAQVLQALRVEIAGRADVEVDEVSMNLLVRDLFEFGRSHPTDPIAGLLLVARDYGYIRPSNAKEWAIPPVGVADYTMPPPDLIRERQPRYPGKM